MEVICSSCNTKLNVPDEKIPKDQIVKINCPKCKNKISIVPPGADEEAPPSQENDSYEDSSSDDSLDYYDDEVKLALAMVDENISDKVKSEVEEYGYKFVGTPNTRDALSKLRYHHFNLIILGEGFDGQEITGGPIMNYLNHLGMSSRRRIFLTIISDKYKTMDDMMAFSLSANMIVNSKDLEKLSTLLKRGISDYEKFYKVFMDTLKEEGKV